ncbi:hypothetical protein IR083_07705 [Dysgonomonas sp. GY75]|uniref:hypothetical protein n=1 Tax=Dysgonomonas sp. GY75 TaxID=2780419 RepID=UPI001883600F|nr:hypothetical protein [Dysgonomonas sp. GY75]MBF0648702.1 hypothetical protein [Dysgonomonas sp. GY75]
MKPIRLSILMQKIVRQLVCKENQSHFSNSILPLLLPTCGQVRFIWQINNQGTWLYLYDTADWEQTLLDRIAEYHAQDVSNIYYLYDRQKLLPVFENDVRHIAQKRIEARQKKSIKAECNDSGS